MNAAVSVKNESAPMYASNSYEMGPSCSSNTGLSPFNNNNNNGSSTHNEKSSVPTTLTSTKVSLSVPITSVTLSTSVAPTYTNRGGQNIDKYVDAPSTSMVAGVKSSVVDLQSSPVICSNTTGTNIKGGGSINGTNNNSSHIAAISTFIPDAYHHQQMQVQLQQQYEQQYQIQSYYQRQQKQLSEFFEQRVLTDMQHLTVPSAQQQPIFNADHQRMYHHNGHHHPYTHSHMHYHHHPTTSSLATSQFQQRQKYIAPAVLLTPNTRASNDLNAAGTALNTQPNVNFLNVSSGDGTIVMNLNYHKQNENAAGTASLLSTSSTQSQSYTLTMPASSASLRTPSSSSPITGSFQISSNTITTPPAVTSVAVVPSSSSSLPPQSSLQNLKMQQRQPHEQSPTQLQHQQRHFHHHQYHHHHHHHFTQMSSNYRQQL